MFPSPFSLSVSLSLSLSRALPPFYFDLFFLLIRFPTLLVSFAGRAKNTGICRFPGEEQRKRPQQEISSYSEPRLAFSRIAPSHETLSRETSRVIASRDSKAKRALCHPTLSTPWTEELVIDRCRDRCSSS